MAGGNKVHSDDDEVTRERKEHILAEFESAGTRKYLRSKHSDEDDDELEQKVHVMLQR